MKLSLAVFSIFILVFASNCSKTPVKVISKSTTENFDSFYDSEMPQENISKYLNKVSKTIKRLSIITFYIKYEFPPGAINSKSELTKSNILLKSINSKVDSKSVTGTAIVIYYQNDLIGLLTANHVVDFPDTVISWYRDKTQGIGGLAIKLNQKNFISGFSNGDNIEIIATDKKNDLAFLKKKVDEIPKQIGVFNFPLGDINYIDWGSVVYIMGFPVGKMMVTQAIASKPEKAGSSRFLTDATFNHGISGSPVIAIRDGVPNFELVGIAVSAYAKSIFYLKPSTLDLNIIPSNELYYGDAVVAEEKLINYGVTYSVSANEIKKFIKKNQLLFQSEGFNTERFFK
jgi:S1-C subfamily serine protease